LLPAVAAPALGLAGAPAPRPAVAGVFFLAALGFFGSRLLLFCPFAIAVLPCSRQLAGRTVGRALRRPQSKPRGRSQVRPGVERPPDAFNEASVAFFGANEINILGTRPIMVLTLMYFPNGIVGTLANKNRLPRWLNSD
jgi:hypothetical protein